MSTAPDSSPDPAPEAALAHAASAWVLRCDRGLTPAEQDDFSAWLAADSRHGAHLALARRDWQRLNALAHWGPEHGATPNPDLLAPPARSRVVAFLPYVGLAAAGALVFLFFRLRDSAPAVPAHAATVATNTPASTTRTLADGTVVELNHLTALSVEFTATARRVRLAHGEAHFAVTKDPARPFIVHAGGVEVRAVGTAFNVRLGSGTLEVLVTEGKVGVERGAAVTAERSVAEPLQLGPRQRAVVSLAADAPPPQVATLTAGEIERVLAWQHRVMDFTAVPLRDIVAEFNRRNVVQIAIADPALAATRISASFRTDNLDGFVHLLEAGFGASAERRGPDEIVLRRAQP